MNVTNSSSTSILLLLSLLFIVSSSSLRANSQPDVGCSLVNCGQGTCKASNTSIIGIDCECYPGWKKIQIGPISFPSCILPNCTINLGCNGATPTQPPWAQPTPPVSPPPPPQTPLLNLSNSCSLTWCGDGVCLANGTGRTCKCNAGAFNLKNLTDLPCLNPCSLGADCGNIGLGPEFPQPPRAPTASTPSSPTSSLLESAPPAPESTEGKSSAAGHRALTAALPLAAAMFFAWF